MPRSAKPRKAYRAKPVHMGQVDAVIAYAAKAPKGERLKLQIPMEDAWAAMRLGGRDAAPWCNLAYAMNVAEQLALRGIASDRLPELQAAQAALHAVHTRQADTGSWTLRGSEIAALEMGVDLHRIQLHHCTQGELRDAIQAVQRRVSQALAGNASPKALICVSPLGRSADAHHQPETTTR